MRHIQTRFLWVQERVAEKHVRITPIPGTKNPADILTKSVTAVALSKHLETLQFREETASVKQRKPSAALTARGSGEQQRMAA